ncbi:MAG TPA: beta-L-arabinofuranosidase domain-containing protein, partial [Streptosporangiaceae bacterium]
TFGGQERGLDGHPEVETALAELYRETGQRAYLDLARQFVEQRGHGLAGDSGRGHRYLQDHLPIRDTVTLEGHAVRALYLEAGVTDVASETGDADLLAGSVRRWEDMVATKTYLTGGNGSRHSDEAFGDRFELPPDRAYTETCAAIASFHWSWRLLLATGDARYADLMERLLYNAFGASISTDGQRFFYVNPLQRRYDHVEEDDPARRHEWFSCACCPPNIMRLLASVQHYLASTAGDTLYLHQFTGATVTTPLAGGTLDVAVSADLPWSGEVTVRVTQAPAGPCGLALRVPAWSGSPQLLVNGEPVQATAAQGYLTVTRTWQPGDVLAATFDLTPRWVYPHPRIDAVRGCAAVERGPLVYCFEHVDQADGTDLDDLALVAGSGLAKSPATLAEIGRTVLVEL